MDSRDRKQVQTEANDGKSLLNSEMDRPLIDSRGAALGYAAERAPGARPDQCLLLLLSSESRLLSSQLLPWNANEDVDADYILHAALDADAAGFLIISWTDAEPSRALRHKVVNAAGLCREFGIHFVDHLRISGSGAHSLVWDTTSTARSGWNPWSTD